METAQNTANTTINTVNFKAGTYYYKVIDNNGTSVAGGKFIKQ
jgi:hypothetical protein